MSEAASEPDSFERFLSSFLARRSARWALILLAILYACAIYAPLIANDRPYFLRAIDRGAYVDAQRTSVPIAETLSELVSLSPGEFERTRGGGAKPTRAQAIAAESAALEQRLAILRAHLADSDTSLLDRCETSIEAVLRAERSGRDEKTDRDAPVDRAEHDARGAADAGARSAAAEVVALAREIRAELTPLDPAHPERGGRVLHARASYPLCESLSALDVFFMSLGFLAITAPLWNRAANALLLGRDPARIRAARAKKITFVLIVTLCAALVRSFAAGERSSSASAPFKSAIARGELVVERAVFAPIAMGFAETNAAEANRPPTWLPSSEISEEGYYVRGPRAARADPITGLRPPPTPVEVRRGEPERNALLRHPLGTDSLGRDLLVRLLWGARTSLAIGLLAALFLTAIGTAIGALAGYCGGWIDAIASRGIEIVLCVPAFFLILAVVAFTDPDVLPPIFAIVIVIALVAWTGVARLVRAEFLRLRELEFVLAARAMGYSPARVVLRHMLPNALGPVLVAGPFAVASSTLYEAALSFLGLGIGHPIPSWGALINDSHSADQWWIQVFPGACLFATVLAYNLLGDGLQDVLDPRSSARPRNAPASRPAAELAA
jgi:peptide/nickel transport system permease protein